jgi:hypothetical protein
MEGLSLAAVRALHLTRNLLSAIAFIDSAAAGLGAGTDVGVGHERTA